MTDTSKTPSKGAMIAAGAIVTGCTIGLMTFAEASEIIDRETHAGEMEELLRELRKAAVSLVWEPMGTTGDESDWFICEICGGRTRGIGNGHKSNCIMVRAERLLKELGS